VTGRWRNPPMQICCHKEQHECVTYNVRNKVELQQDKPSYVAELWRA